MSQAHTLEIESQETTDEGQMLVVNFGPQHPATHGTLRCVFYTDGERIVRAIPDLGYLHTGFEKLAEHMTYAQWMVTTDRMNYFSAICNNIGWAHAIEEFVGIEVPERAQYIRMILAELARIAEHFVFVGLLGMDVGAFTGMLWTFKEREKVYDILDACCGSRLTNTYARIGGLMRDVPTNFKDMVRNFLKTFPETLDDVINLLHKNRIFQKRLQGIGILSKEDAIAYGACGPVLRASGVEYDIRKDRPYLKYDEVEFDVPTLEEGDCYARYWQRILEIRQSLRIVEQCLQKLPDKGPIIHPDYKVGVPQKKDVYTDMESLIHHFKMVMPGHQGQVFPPKEIDFYSATEAPNGELGFYVVGSGGHIPYRVRIHPPSLKNYQLYPHLVKGALIADAVPILASLWIIAGELDR
ncbi:MAG: NADH-quinone oxidoreductase subunit D [Planctomycetota bacterium]|nr:MAG: NADH-quinone oxidoreductase subunit D [Planctomycetota bacterium]